MSSVIRLASCEHCGSGFVTQRDDARFCSRDCKQKASAARRSDEIAANRKEKRDDPVWREWDKQRKRDHWASGYGQRAKDSRQRVKAEWQARGCMVCGLKTRGVIAAHHVDPAEKDKHIGDLRSAPALREELAKCVPLCLNHHQLLHIQMRKHPAASLDALLALVKDEYPETMWCHGVA